MPFKSDEQRAYLYANKPDVARKFQEHETDSAAGRALKSMKDFLSGEYGKRKEQERVKPPEGITGVRG